MLNGADFNGSDIQQAVGEVEAIAEAENGDAAYRLARELTGKYTVKGQPVIADMSQFERLVIKSIGVANLLAER